MGEKGTGGAVSDLFCSVTAWTVAVPWCPIVGCLCGHYSGVAFNIHACFWSFGCRNSHAYSCASVKKKNLWVLARVGLPRG